MRGDDQLTQLNVKEVDVRPRERWTCCGTISTAADGAPAADRQSAGRQQKATRPHSSRAAFIVLVEWMHSREASVLQRLQNSAAYMSGSDSVACQVVECACAEADRQIAVVDSVMRVRGCRIGRRGGEQRSAQHHVRAP